MANAALLSSVTGFPADTEVDVGDNLFMLTDIDGINDDATIFLLAESPAISAFNEVGIYDPINGNSLALLNASDGILSSATVSWVGGIATNAASLVSIAINPLSFGFYVINQVGVTISSQSIFNGGIDEALVFDTTSNSRSGLLGSDVVVGFNDGIGAFDFGNTVIGGSDIEPVRIAQTPIPSTIGLMGFGLVGIAGLTMRREKKFNQKN